MNAEEFMRLHADNAVAGKIPEVMKDLTPESLAQVGVLLPAAPQPFTGNKVVTIKNDVAEGLFDVTYTADAGTVTWRETVKQVDGTWKIVDIVKPA